jgi:hypothetical protein
MPNLHFKAPRILTLLVCLLIGRILAGILWNYRNYLPPNFQADFLLGRQSYFWQGYQWAFYPHIFAGPLSLILGTILISDQFRRPFPKWHRFFGRVQAVCVIFVVAPSGLGMATRAANGPVQGAGFVLLAFATAASMALGWRAARQRRFNIHRQWMCRNFLMLFSTVLVRVNGGIGEFLGISDERFYSHTAWTSWLVPLILFELAGLKTRRPFHFLSPRESTSMSPG